MEPNKKRKRIVVKIGSSSLTNPSGELSRDKLNFYVKAISHCKDQGYEVILVSSGAVAAGFSKLGFPTRPITLDGKQAAAAIGQGLLIQAYTEEFNLYHYAVAQILLTRSDFLDQERYKNAHNALSLLLKRGVIPIINENDTVSVKELTFGDNDLLSSYVAGILHADLLIILTDTDGIYTDNPQKNKQAKKIERIDQITPQIEALAGPSFGNVGTGGMVSKIAAAKLANSFGLEVYIGANRKGEHYFIEQIISGNGTGTYIGTPALASLKTRKQWIAFHSPSNGKIVIDQGATDALTINGKSLLPSGIKWVEGRFKDGAVVTVFSIDGTLIGKGITNFNSDQIEKIKGRSTAFVIEHFPEQSSEVIHRDNWVTLQEQKERAKVYEKQQ